PRTTTSMSGAVRGVGDGTARPRDVRRSDSARTVGRGDDEDRTTQPVTEARGRGAVEQILDVAMSVRAGDQDLRVLLARDARELRDHVAESEPHARGDAARAKLLRQRIERDSILPRLLVGGFRSEVPAGRALDHVEQQELSVGSE